MLPDPQSPTPRPKSHGHLALLALGKSVLVNMVAPGLIYSRMHGAASHGSLLPLAASGLPPALWLGWSWWRKRALDFLSVFAAENVVVAMAALVLAHTEQQALIGRSLQNVFLTALFLATLAVRRPMLFYMTRQLTTGNDPAGRADFDASADTPCAMATYRALTWMPTNGGLINPAAEVGAIARGAGIPYLLDACQAVGQVPVDVEALGCDMLCATGRKFLRAPRDTGFLYIRRAFMQRCGPPMIDHFCAPWTADDSYTLRPDARRFEAWESSIATRLGLGVAVDYALDVGLEAIAARCAMLAGRLRQGLGQVPGIEMLDLGRHQSAIVSFRMPARDIRLVLARAEQAGIVIGASPHYFNIEAEIDRLIDLCSTLAAGR